MPSFSKNVAAVAVGVVVSALLVTALYAWRAWSYYTATPKRVGAPAFIPDPELGFQMSPHISMLTRHGIYSSDERGSRADHPFSQVAKGPVLLAGCSYAYGLGIRFDETFGSLLEEKYGRPTYNAAITGYNTRAARLRAQRFLELEPSHVVYGFIDDHLARNLKPCAPTQPPFCRPFPYWERVGRRIEPRLRPATFWYAHGEALELGHDFGMGDLWWALLRDVAGGIDFHWMEQIPKNPVTPQEDPALAEAALGFEVDEWLASAEAHGFTFVFLRIPQPCEAVVPAPAEVERVVAKRRAHPRFRYLDLTDQFLAYEKAHGPGSLLVEPKDCHPNKEANALIAEALAKELSRPQR